MAFRNRIFIMLLFLLISFSSEIYLFQTIANGRENDNRKQLLSKSDFPIMVLENSLSPTARLDNKRGIIISGVYWISSYPLVAQEVNSKGNSLWPNVPYGIPISHPGEEGDATPGPPMILPKKGGGAFFAYNYWKFMGREGLEIGRAHV